MLCAALNIPPHIAIKLKKLLSADETAENEQKLFDVRTEG
jgi:hypothetical protein